MLEKAKLNYSCVTIAQAYDLNETLEELKIKRYGATIELVDVVNMYPSIKIATIKKKLRLFTRVLTASTQKTINLCLERIFFWVSSALTYFNGEFYE